MRFRVSTARDPEARELEDGKGRVVAVFLGSMVEHCSQVVLFGVEPGEAFGAPNVDVLAIPVEGEAVKAGVPAGKPSSSIFALAFAGVLANCLQHPVAAVCEAEEALLDEGLHCVEVGVGNLFCGFQCAATGEDGQRSEDSLLLCGQQVIAPGDGRAQSLLAGVNIPAASQQVEAVG